MRPVKVERKLRGNPRTNAARGTVRAAREKPAASPPPSGKRDKKTDRLPARILRAVGGFFARPMLLVILGLAAFTLVAALFASGFVSRTARRFDQGVTTVLADAGFGITEIHITGNRRTPFAGIREALAMQPGQSIFTPDLWDAQKRLSRLEWVADAEVHRRYPDAIFVTLVEKRPFALWQAPPDPDGHAPIAVVERNGNIITWRDVEQFRRLPKLAGAGAPAAAAELVDLVRTHRAVAARVAGYSYQSGRRWNLILDDGVVVELPESGWQKQIDALEHLIVDAGILERDLNEIDLRSPTHFFFVLRSGEKKDVERGKET